MCGLINLFCAWLCLKSINNGEIALVVFMYTYSLEEEISISCIVVDKCVVFVEETNDSCVGAL